MSIEGKVTTHKHNFTGRESARGSSRNDYFAIGGSQTTNNDARLYYFYSYDGGDGYDIVEIDWGNTRNNHRTPETWEWEQRSPDVGNEAYFMLYYKNHSTNAYTSFSLSNVEEVRFNDRSISLPDFRHWKASDPVKEVPAVDSDTYYEDDVDYYDDSDYDNYDESSVGVIDDSNNSSSSSSSSNSNSNSTSTRGASDRSYVEKKGDIHLLIDADEYYYAQNANGSGTFDVLGPDGGHYYKNEEYQLIALENINGINTGLWQFTNNSYSTWEYNDNWTEIENSGVSVNGSEVQSFGQDSLVPSASTPDPKETKTSNVSDDNDDIIGTKKGDKLKGSNSDDYIDGGKGDDTIEGLNGEDIIIGGKGIDVIYTGNGADMIVMSKKLGKGAKSYDIVMDFTKGEDYLLIEDKKNKKYEFESDKQGDLWLWYKSNLIGYFPDVQSDDIEWTKTTGGWNVEIS